MQKVTLDGYDVTTETLSGNIGAGVAAEIKSFDHFTYDEADSTASGSIAADGSLVLKVYYNRNTYKIITRMGIGGTGTVSATNTYPYGKKITVSASVKSGYEFLGWYCENEQMCEDTSYTFTVSENITLVAYAYKLNTGAPSLGVGAYNGNLYVNVNGGVPTFTSHDCGKSYCEHYDALDALERCGVAYAKLNKALMPSGTRGSLSHKPTGWYQAGYPDLNVSYIYNRCHLIGWQLTGQDDFELNLVTGTPYFNVSGMLPFENMVADYLKEFPNNHVLYRVEPIFDGDNLLANGVHMQAYSVEDNGRELSFNVFVYNVQRGVLFDYATGKNCQNPETIIVEEEDDEDSGDGTQTVVTYIVNTKSTSMKIHLPTCTWVEKMSESNKWETTKTLDELLDMGYTCCGSCKPDQKSRSIVIDVAIIEKRLKYTFLPSRESLAA